MRGLAYVQNHPLEDSTLPGSAGGSDASWDAVNEVWFDDVESLEQRVRWMAENVSEQGDPLFGARNLFAVREDVLPVG